MKRVLEREETLDHCLQKVIWELVLPPIFSQCSQLTTVCKEWREVIDSYNHWLESARALYLSGESDQYISQRFKSFSEWEASPALPGGEKEGFRVYGGPGDNEREAVMFYRVIQRPAVSRFPINRIFLLEEIHALIYYLEHFVAEARFRNHIGRLLVAKHRLFSSQEGEDEKLSPCTMLLALCDYVDQKSSSKFVRRNFHWRDINITFEEEDHRYTLYNIWCPERQRYVSIRSHRDLDDNESLNSFRSLAANEDDLRTDVYFCDLRSVTTFIGCLFPEFVADEVLARMRNKVMSDDEYKALWDSIRDIASRKGTKMHLKLENRSLGRPYKRKGREVSHFEAFEKAILLGRWIEFRVEWEVWDDELMICGSIDVVYEEVIKRVIPGRDPRKKYVKLGDYKRSKEIKMFNTYESGIPECEAVAHLGDCNYFHYMIQLALYKYILEKHYDVVVLGMFIIVLHPDQETYIKIDMCPKPGFIESILDYRRQQLARRREERQTLFQG